MRYTSLEEHSSAKAEFGLIWLVYGLGSLGVVALVAKPNLISAAVLGVALAVVAYRLPELLLVLFLVVGPLKSTDVGARVAGSLPAGADLTAFMASALLAAVCLSLWRRRDEPFALPAAALGFVALAVLLFLGVPGSPAGEDALDKAVTFVTLSALAFLAPLAIVRSRRSFHRTLALLVVVAVAVGLAAEAPERSESVLVLPGGDNQIQVGLLLGLGAIAVVAYLWPVSSGRLRLVWLLPAGFLLVKLVSAGGRSALAGTALASALALVWLVRSGRHERLAAARLRR